MTKAELRAIPPFDKLPLVSEAGAAWLFPSSDPSCNGVMEASDMGELATFLKNSHNIPKGAIIYEDGEVRAIFWRKPPD